LESELAELRVVNAVGRSTTGGLLAYLVDDRERGDDKRPVGALADPGAVTLLLSYIAPEGAFPASAHGVGTRNCRTVIQWTVRRSLQVGVAAVPTA
jgi:hypothetical protein